MAQIEDYTAMRLWDRAAACLDDLRDAMAWAENNDFTTDVMNTGDVQVAAPVLANLEDMEYALQGEATPSSNNAFFRDFINLLAAFSTWYVSGDQGTFTSVPLALAGRHYRLCYNLKDAWVSQQGGTITSAYLCPVDDIVLCNASRGNAPTYPHALPADVAYARIAVDCNGAIGGPALTVTFTAVYSDDTTAAEVVTVTGGSPNGTRFQAAQNAITGVGAPSGTATIPMTATAGMVAGQKVIVRDECWPAALTSDCVADDVFTVENSLPFNAGDAVQLGDDNTADEAATILSVDHELHQITLTANTVGTFTQAQHAYIRQNVAQAYGWCEVMEIQAVNLNTSIVLTANLNHTYSDQGFVQRLIKTITPVVLTAGTGGDTVDIKAIPDRPTYQALNSSSSSSSSRSFSSSSSHSTSSSSSSMSSSSSSRSSSSSSSA